MRKERKKDREVKKIEEKREKLLFYIICWYSLYYFNELNIKVDTVMLDVL